MPKSTDFSKMTLEELTPIVSMRPGKEYTREELRAARAAFMAALESADASSCVPAEKASEETFEPKMPETAPEINASADADALLAAAEDTPMSDAEGEPPLPAETSSPEFPAAPETTDQEKTPETEFGTEFCIPAAMAPIQDAVPSPAAAASAPETPLEKEETEVLFEDEEFILKTESRLARFLYVLYAYLLVPLLAVEALVFLLASVATAVAVQGIPYLFLHILCAVIYTMIVSIAWHQFLHRTKFGLLLNRALIGVCIFRGFSMLFSGDSVLSGILFLALSILFLVFFVGYDNTFVVKSQAQQHGQ